ncbi:MAG: hypothetical protein CMA56_02135 [Euryarchaeota archaeon]|nr:hypothetical protein [Euryarchaeota archaeon]
MRRREVERGLLFGHALNLHGRPAADLEVGAQAFMLALSAVEDVHTKFGGHVQAVVRACADAQLACGAGFPNHANAPVVVPGNEKPRLHVLEALVRVEDGLRAPDRGDQVARLTVGRVLMRVLGHVVELRVTFDAGLAALIEHLRGQRVVVAPREALPDDGEGP